MAQAAEARGEAGAEVNPSMKDLFQIAVDLASLEVVVEPDPPALARIRVMNTAAHSPDDLERGLAAFEKVGKELGVIS